MGTIWRESQISVQVFGTTYLGCELENDTRISIPLFVSPLGIYGEPWSEGRIYIGRCPAHCQGHGPEIWYAKHFVSFYIVSIAFYVVNAYMHVKFTQVVWNEIRNILKFVQSHYAILDELLVSDLKK